MNMMRIMSEHMASQNCNKHMHKPKYLQKEEKIL